MPDQPYEKAFRHEIRKIFAGEDQAKLRSAKVLNDAGQFLERTPFGLAVVVASSGMKGDSLELETLAQARAMVVRDYLVENFRMDDSRVRTIGLGKNESPSDQIGAVEILIYPNGTPVPVPTNQTAR